MWNGERRLWYPWVGSKLIQIPESQQMVLFFGLCKEWLIRNRTRQTDRKSAIFFDFLGLNIELTGYVYKILMGNKSSVRLTNNTYFINLRASQHSPFWKWSQERTLIMRSWDQDRCTVCRHDGSPNTWENDS